MQISGKNINLKEYIEPRVKQEKQNTYKKRRLLTLVYLTLKPPYIITTLIILLYILSSYIYFSILKISSCVKASTKIYLASINRYLSLDRRAIKS